MEHEEFKNQTPDSPLEEITMKEVMDKATEAIKWKILKQAGGLDSPDKFTWYLTCPTTIKGAEFFNLINKGIVLSAFEVSRDRRISRLKLASKIVDIHGNLNVDPKCERMQFKIVCSWSPNANTVADPSITRDNIADGSIDNNFNNLLDLKMMGLSYRIEEKSSFMRILWQFNGAAEEDVRESLALQISGGDKECHFERTRNTHYSIFGVQSRFVLCGDAHGEKVNDVEVLCIKNLDIDGTILEAKFDRTNWEWKCVLGKDVIINGERAFSGTVYSLNEPATITVEGISIRLIPKGHPTKHRKLFRFRK